MVEMIANKQIHGRVRVDPGQRFMVTPDVAESYAKRGLADYYYPPVSPIFRSPVSTARILETYETKVIAPLPAQTRRGR